MIYLLVFFTLYVPRVYSQLTLRAQPASTVVAGTEVKLACRVINKKLNVVWKFSNKTKSTEKFIGEDCTLNKNYACQQNKDTYTLILNSVRWEDRGIWSCSHGASQQESVTLEVIVPAYVHSPQISLNNVAPLRPAGSSTRVLSPSFSNYSLSKSMNDQPSGYLFGIGTRIDPIDLTDPRTGAPNSVVIRCSTTCASLETQIQWNAQNSTFAQIVESLPAMPEDPKLPSCPAGLQAFQSQTELHCASNARPMSDSDGGGRNFHFRSRPLVGLNRVVCATKTVNNMDAYLGYITASRSGRNAGHNLPTASSRDPADDTRLDCLHQPQQRAGCVYVLCPGPTADWLTLGERVALAVSCALIMLLSILLCHLTRERRRAKQKALMAPGQRHEIELML